SDDRDMASLVLLYRSKCSFALGHGCSAEWTISLYDPSRAVEVRSEFLPRYDLKPVRPREQPFSSVAFDLSMQRLSDSGFAEGSNADIIAQLSALADDYEAWVEASSRTATTLAIEYQEPAARHLTDCRSCLTRMREG